MPDNTNEFVIRFVLDSQDKASAVFKSVGVEAQNLAGGAFGKLQEAARGVQSQLGALPMGLGAIATAAVASVAGILSFKYALDKLHQTISEGTLLYSKAAQNQAQLATAWAMAGHSLPVEAINQYSTALEKSTTFSAGAINAAAKMLATMPAVTGELMPKALQAAADIAAFTGSDITEAASRLARASEGMLGGLERMRIPLSQTTRQTKDFGAVLDDVNRALGGQAAQATETYHGKLEKIDQQYTKLTVTVGKFFEPIKAGFAGAKLDFLEGFVAKVKEAVDGGKLANLQKLIGNLALGFEKLGEEILNSVGSLTEFMEALAGAGGKPSEILESILGKGGTGFQLEFRGKEIFKWDPLGDWLNKLSEDGKKAREEVEKTKSDVEKTLSEKGAGPSVTATGGTAEYEAIVAQANAALGNLSSAVDWKLEEIKAQAYFDRLKEQAQTAYEAEKAEIQATSQTKEEADRRMFSADLAYGQQRIAMAQAEHDKMIALKEEEWAKEERQITARHPMAAEGNKNEQANLAEELKELNEKRAQGQIEAEKRVTTVIEEELQKRYGEIQKHEESVRDLQQKLVDAQIEGSKAILEIGNKSVDEAGRVIVKQQEIAETLKLAQEAIESNPQHAIELANQAKGMIGSLVQDINAMKLSLIDFNRATTEGLLNIQKKGMSPFAGWVADIEMVESLQQQARVAAEQGDLETAQKLAASAGQKAQGLANAPEGVNLGQAMQIASDAFVQSANLEREFRLAIIDREEKKQAEAKALEEQRQAIHFAAIQLQIDTANSQTDALKTNTAALQALTNAMQRGAPGTPGGTQPAGEGAPGTGGWYGTPGTVIGGGTGTSVVGTTTGTMTPEQAKADYESGAWRPQDSRNQQSDEDWRKERGFGEAPAPGRAGTGTRTTGKPLASYRNLPEDEQLAYLQTQAVEEGGSVESGQYDWAKKVNDQRLQRKSEEEQAAQADQRIGGITTSEGWADLAAQQAKRQSGLDSRWQAVADGIEARKQALGEQVQSRMERYQDSGETAIASNSENGGAVTGGEIILNGAKTFMEAVQQLATVWKEKTQINLTVNGEDRGQQVQWQMT